jgi:two-component system, LuxR family, response regulator FixJ
MPSRSNLVLIVDDDAAVGSALRFSLEQEGFHVRLYGSGKSLLAETGVPDQACLVIDYIMPEMDGLQVVDELRARGNRAPVILISPSIGNGLRRRARKRGIRFFLEKPLLEGTLPEVIRMALAAGNPPP